MVTGMSEDPVCSIMISFCRNSWTSMSRNCGLESFRSVVPQLLCAPTIVKRARKLDVFQFLS